MGWEGITAAPSEASGCYPGKRGGNAGEVWDGGSSGGTGTPGFVFTSKEEIPSHVRADGGLNYKLNPISDGSWRKPLAEPEPSVGARPRPWRDAGHPRSGVLAIPRVSCQHCGAGVGLGEGRSGRKRSSAGEGCCAQPSPVPASPSFQGSSPSSSLPNLRRLSPEGDFSPHRHFSFFS